MNRRIVLWITVTGVFSTAALAQSVDPRALADHTCQRESDYALRDCTQRIGAMHERLNRAFVVAHRVAPQDADEAAQQRWLAELIKNCGEKFCMQDALARRTMEMRAIEMRSYDVADSPMNDAEAGAVCANVAAIESRGDIDDLLLPISELRTSTFANFQDGEKETKHDGQLDKEFTLELRKGRPVSFGSYMGRGTCVMFSIEPVRSLDLAEDLKWPVTISNGPESEEDLHLIGWGGGETVLAHRGRHYIATYGGDQHGIAYLEWLTPAGTRRGLCTLEDNGSERIVTSRLDRNADCDALARAPGEAVTSLMSVDLDNDGKLDTVGASGEDSGAGCGHSWRNLTIVDAKGETEVSQRNKDLARLIGIESGPVMLLTSKAKEYVYATNGADVPTVYLVTKTAVVPQCEFRVQYKRRVKTQFVFTPSEREIDDDQTGH